MKKIEILESKNKEIEKAYNDLNNFISNLYGTHLSDYELFTFKDLSSWLNVYKKTYRSMVNEIKIDGFYKGKFIDEVKKQGTHIIYMIYNVIPFKSEVTSEIEKALR